MNSSIFSKTLLIKLTISKTSGFIVVFSISLFTFFFNQKSKEQNNPIAAIPNLAKSVPIGSNSWVVNNPNQDHHIISKNGIHNWTSLDAVIRTYFKTGKGKLKLGLNIKCSEGKSKIKVTLGQVSKEIVISNTEYKTIMIDTFDVNEGYNFIEIQGLSKTKKEIADITDLILDGSAVTSKLMFNPTSNHYFGRRGPSVHLKYKIPTKQDVLWFYNEITVPVGQDKIGSFFMTNGHSQGYFGMQVNSKSERRVLFSIWSAYKTDDPSQIPIDYKVTKLNSGSGVTVKDFGNEGSGIQSYIDVDWKPGVTYKFLLKGEPSIIKGSTDYTGYFYDPEIGSWKLISKLRRPKTNTYLTGLHSFLENFNPSTGYKSRQGNFKNQWVYTKEDKWIEVTESNFTYDATAAAGNRLDFYGSTKDSDFILKNCGFFNQNTKYNTALKRLPNSTPPVVNFSQFND